MSLLHDFIQSIVRHGHVPYDPNNPPDYLSRRLKEEARFKSLPKDLKVQPIKQDEIEGEFICKKGNDENNIILYIHGGGFVGGSAKARRNITFYLARHSGYNVISINYPLAPEARFPVPVETCFKAYSYLVKQCGAKHIAIMGESAGGNLVLATLLMAKDKRVELPSSISVFSPACVLGKQMPSYLKNGKKDAMLDENFHLEMLDAYLNSLEDSLNPYASPLYGDFHAFPDTLVFASDSEVLMDDSVLLNQKMREDGVQVDFVLAHKMMHAYVTMPYFKEAFEGLQRIMEFVKEHFHS